MIQVMLDQEYDPQLDGEWLTENEQLTCFSKARELVVEKVKGAESPYVQGTQYSKEELVVMERFTMRTESLSVR